MKIRSLFSTTRPIDRPIEKVIDYAADDEPRLEAEISEYEVTDNIQSCFDKFLGAYEPGVRKGDAPEIGIWVSGFYGSGKSSFTKYLGFALDHNRTVGGRPFLDLLAERIDSTTIRANLRAVAIRNPAAVLMLDLGSNQLTGGALRDVTDVLWARVLQWAGFSSSDLKIAELELFLEGEGKLEEFKELYLAQRGKRWEEEHNNPLLAIPTADRLLPQILPDVYDTPGKFLALKFVPAIDVRARAAQMIDLIRRRSGSDCIVFVIDEAGQYVAPHRDFILNLDGLARSLKDLGRGKVWIVATGQQTLSETEVNVAYNSLDLFKLKERFPIAIDLQAQDIREITQRRLLTKSADGDALVRSMYREAGAQLTISTRLEASELYQGAAKEDQFTLLYPFLPQHFEILFSMVRTLARSTGGIGLRSSIRVVQDVLVDASKLLGGATPLADQEVGTLARVDHFYDSLRADIAKALPHVAEGMDQVRVIFGDDEATMGVAKAIAALQVIEGFPRTAENIAALLYPAVGAPSLLEGVRAALEKLSSDPETGIVNDPSAGGYQFLSGGIRNLRDERDRHIPTAAEVARLRTEALKRLLDPMPNVLIENTKRVEAGVFFQSARISDQQELNFQIEPCAADRWEQRRTELLASSKMPEMKDRIVWLFREPDELDGLLADCARSKWIVDKYPEPHADIEVGKYVRSESVRRDYLAEQAQKSLGERLVSGVFICDGKDTSVASRGTDCTGAASAELRDAASRLYSKLHLAPIRPKDDLAARFLGLPRLDNVTKDVDPLGFVKKKDGTHRVDLEHEALIEALRVFEDMYKKGGDVPVSGARLMDRFDAPEFGWTKDTTRYVFGALLTAGKIEIKASSEKYKTPSPETAQHFRSAPAFRVVGVSPRDSQISLEALQLSADRLRDLFGDDVFPSEQQIAKTVRDRFPDVIGEIAGLPDRLRLLGLPEVERAATVLATCTEMTRGDASDAPARLGDAEGILAADVRWARDASRGLNDGAEDDIRQARRVIGEMGRLVQDHDLPDDARDDTALARIQELLDSGHWLVHRAELRTDCTGIQAKALSHYRNQVAIYKAAVEAAQRKVEALPEWNQIPPDARLELIGRVQPASFEDKPEDPLARLGDLLAKASALAGVAALVAQEVPNHVPPPPKPTKVKRLRSHEVVKPGVISDTDDLTQWITELRQRLDQLLREEFRLEIGDDG